MHENTISIIHLIWSLALYSEQQLIPDQIEPRTFPGPHIVN